MEFATGKLQESAQEGGSSFCGRCSRIQGRLGFQWSHGSKPGACRCRRPSQALPTDVRGSVLHLTPELDSFSDLSPRYHVSASYWQGLKEAMSLVFPSKLESQLWTLPFWLRGIQSKSEGVYAGEEEKMGQLQEWRGALWLAHHPI